jgi:prephenate dehydrogenase
VVGGSGAVGQMFTVVLARAGVSVCVVDPIPPASLPPGVRWVDGDIRAPGDAVSAEVAQVDLLLLAVPEPVAVAAVPVLTDLLPGKALLADTLSVKERMAAAMRGFPDRQAVSFNPMFAPALGMRGRPVVAVVFHGGPLVDDLLVLVEESGGRVVQMEALQHDRLAAIAQALTHATVLAFGHALLTLDADIEELIAVAPPPHAILLALLARIASGNPEVYWDVQSGNPLVSEAHEALAGGLEHVRNIVRSSSGADFKRLLLDIGDVFGGRLEYVQRMCAQLFANTALLASEERA